MDICLDCQAELPVQSTACYRCALPLHGVTTDTRLLCGRCLNDPPSHDHTLSAFRYAHPIDHLIHDLKFNRKLAVARLLGELMAQQLKKQIQTCPQMIIPVPLHAARLRERGYNQATELARPMARALGIPIDYQHCQRQRATAIQSDLPASERSRNVKGVFSVVKKLPAHHVAIVDDVMTTGATVAELATTLRHAGVEKIDVWVCARAALS
jgi:ComF family protein